MCEESNVDGSADPSKNNITLPLFNNKPLESTKLKSGHAKRELGIAKPSRYPSSSDCVGWKSTINQQLELLNTFLVCNVTFSR
jgi:hypothetical protein